MKLGDRELDLSQPRVMTIINVTDDSFFEHSRTDDEQSIAERVKKAYGEGAEIFDIGGYSSRPGARELTVEEEWSRVRLGL
jgi:dihydropteroate synthase